MTDMPMPVSPPPAESVATIQSLGWLWAWLWPAMSSVFGAGVVWGTSRSTTVEHGKRLSRLEAQHDELLEKLTDKIDSNHKDLTKMIFDLASKGQGH